MAIQWTRQEKIKRGIWAAAFAACIFVGTITGAQIKQDKQKEEMITSFRATSPSEQIAILEDQKKLLLEQKAVLQRKIDLFHERVIEREEEKARRAK
ncbi:Fc.00g035890.m01.CDS01 [Cosmosporella sp. VM-42]